MNQLRLIFCNQKDLAKVLGWCKLKFPWRRSYHILDHGKTQMYLLDVTGDSRNFIAENLCVHVIVFWRLVKQRIPCISVSLFHHSFSLLSELAQRQWNSYRL